MKQWRVTAEAMASARPVIGYNSTGTAELIEHESTGLLYGGGHEELARCMARLIENPEWAKELGINGWHKAKREFTIETYAERVYKVLKKVTGQ
jgi:glycosyltransferase involved in cell wall biosynthesis